MFFQYCIGAAKKRAFSHTGTDGEPDRGHRKESLRSKIILAVAGLGDSKQSAPADRWGWPARSFWLHLLDQQKVEVRSFFWRLIFLVLFSSRKKEHRDWTSKRWKRRAFNPLWLPLGKGESLCFFSTALVQLKGCPANYLYQSCHSERSAL